MGKIKFPPWAIKAGFLVIGFAAGVVSMGCITHKQWLIASIKLNLSWAGILGWFGALSGWAAAAGALYATWKTLPELRMQVAEAKRQSDFMVGDAAPEFIVQRNRVHRRILLIVRNWNRRRVLIDNIKLSASNNVQLAGVEPFGEDNLSQWLDEGKSGTVRYGVNGWLDRQKQPPERKLQLRLLVGGVMNDDPAVIASSMTLTVAYRIVGQEHEERTATVIALEIAEES
ncbi:hypothetical protein [Mesorhizobium amorphae]|uniref:hypothetical protein n=1 Tax=Mesorhizobium amorphae TaxID=71433 RepID=UPI001182C83E|nr:hypothetical protein [Mesorhizobium amorphae]